MQVYATVRDGQVRIVFLLRNEGFVSRGGASCDSLQEACLGFCRVHRLSLPPTQLKPIHLI